MIVRQDSLRMIDAVGVAVCLAISAGVFGFGVRPMLQRQSELERARAALVDQRIAAQEAAVALTEMRRQVLRAEQSVEAHPLRLQPLDRLNAWLALIAETAADSGVELDQLEPHRAGRAQHYMTVPIRLMGRGSFAASTKFLHRLHDAMPDTAVTSLQLSGNPQAPAAPAQFRFELIWHAAPQGASQASAQTP